jgi:hypothetical protein
MSPTDERQEAQAPEGSAPGPAGRNAKSRLPVLTHCLYLRIFPYIEKLLSQLSHVSTFPKVRCKFLDMETEIRYNSYGNIVKQ